MVILEHTQTFRRAGPSTPALYRAEVVHVRREGVRHSFRHGTYLWLVDLDDVPALRRPWSIVASFRPRDHAGDPQMSIRANLERWLDQQGVRLGSRRVVMLTAAAVLGHVFNPLTLYWCLDDDGRVSCAVAEVHNTYGGRHRYLLYPDAADRSTVAKRFYVSPFFPVDGHYVIRAPLPGDRLSVSVHLWRPDGETDREHLGFAAALTGRRRPATRAELVRLLIRFPLPTLRVAALIRLHGVWLWLRGLPIVPRPADDDPARDDGSVSHEGSRR